MTSGPGEPRRGRRFDLGSVLMILAGIVLLLPGVCALFVAVAMLPSLGTDGGLFFLLAILWAACFAVGYGGIKLIQRAFR
jgi:hypothetical protein